jgi:ligand-binding sensor domain-containing protein
MHLFCFRVRDDARSRQVLLLRLLRAMWRWPVLPALLLLLLLLVVTVGSPGEQPPLRRYTTTDGLPSNTINCVKRDSHGFLWFCTAEGLARFDGYSFVTYGVEQGCPTNLSPILSNREAANIGWARFVDSRSLFPSRRAVRPYSSCTLSPQAY